MARRSCARAAAAACRNGAKALGTTLGGAPMVTLEIARAAHGGVSVGHVVLPGMGWGGGPKKRAAVRPTGRFGATLLSLLLHCALPICMVPPPVGWSVKTAGAPPRRTRPRRSATGQGLPLAGVPAVYAAQGRDWGGSRRAGPQRDVLGAVREKMVCEGSIAWHLARRTPLKNINFDGTDELGTDSSGGNLFCDGVWMQISRRGGRASLRDRLRVRVVYRMGSGNEVAPSKARFLSFGIALRTPSSEAECLRRFDAQFTTSDSR